MQPSFVGAGALLVLALGAPPLHAEDQPRVADILDEVVRSPASAALASRPVAEARHALERAKAARATGDTAQVDRLEALAREWAETARDLARAVVAENEAESLEAKTRAAIVLNERGRTLLEESIARRGEAEARLAQRESAQGAERAVATRSGEPSKTPGKPRREKSAATAAATKTGTEPTATTGPRATLASAPDERQAPPPASAAARKVGAPPAPRGGTTPPAGDEP